MEAKIPEDELTQETSGPVFSEEMTVPAEEPVKVKIPKKKKKHRWLKVLIVLAVLGAAAAILVIRTRNSQSGQVSSDYLVDAAERRDLTVSVSGTATLEPADSYNVTSLISGEILRPPFRRGDYGKKDSAVLQGRQHCPEFRHRATIGWSRHR